MADSKSKQKIPNKLNKSKDNINKTQKSLKGNKNTKSFDNKNNFTYTLLNEIILIFIIVISMIISMSIFSDKMGIVGNIISRFFKGILGFGAYIMPIIAIIYCFWLLFSRSKSNKFTKIIGILMFIIFVSSLIFIIFESDKIEDNNFLKKLINMYNNGSLLNGGVIGGIIGSIFLSSFGKLGSIIIIIAFIIISFIIITGKSIISIVKKYTSNKLNNKNKFINKNNKNFNLNINNNQKVKKNKKVMQDIVLDSEEYKNNNEKPYIEETFFKENKNKKIKKAERVSIYDFKIEEHKNINNSKKDNVLDIKESENKFNEVPFEMINIKKEVIQSIDDININKSDIYKNEKNIEIEKESNNLESLFDDYQFEIDSFKINSFNIPDMNNISERINFDYDDKEKEYIFPSTNILYRDNNIQTQGSKLEMINNANKLEETLKSFGVDAKVVQINKGPTVTRYEISPSQGVKVSKIVNLSDDIALNLAATGIRIEAPIPGKSVIGIEIPNKELKAVYLRNVIESKEFENFDSKLAFALGEDISGNIFIADIAKMPHLLIAGATGSGKSVCINTLIASIIYKARPDEVKLILIDPKVVELNVYNGIPHLLIPVVTEPQKASSALNWAVKEMLKRYNIFAEHNVRDIKGYNRIKKEKDEFDFMPQIVIIIDELADLMMVSPKEIEDAICRLAQMARAAGIHLIIATQRPSVDIITGVIKANIPSRLAFAVSSGTDSRTIIDTVGAEKLLGKGDMLFYPVGMNKPIRLQGAFVTDKEIESIVNFVKEKNISNYNENVINEITLDNKNFSNYLNNNLDEYFEEAINIVIDKQKASISMLQRYLKIGYNRAANIMETLEFKGIVGAEDGGKIRKVLISREEFDNLKKDGFFE